MASARARTGHFDHALDGLPMVISDARIGRRDPTEHVRQDRHFDDGSVTLIVRGIGGMFSDTVPSWSPARKVS